MSEDPKSVVIVGGGFAGVGCAKVLARHDLHVTLIDKHNYHQFQPLLYQVATAQAKPSDIAEPLREIFAHHDNVDVKKATVTGVDPATRTVDTAEGVSYTGDYLVLAAGSRPNFFGTPGAPEHAFPLYSLRDAERLRSRIFELFEEADTRPEVIDEGALNFVIVGGGPTGVETAGSLADLIDDVLTSRFHDMDPTRARIVLADLSPTLLGPFSDSVHTYVAEVLEGRGVELRLETGVAEVHQDRVVFADGSELPSRCVVWAGGLQAAELEVGDGATRGRGGRIEARPDLTLEGLPRVYAIGDVANVDDGTGSGRAHPQLGSVALQAGQWAAKNIVRDLDGKPARDFEYHDKGIMAMIGRNAAVAEVGKHRHELHGHTAFAAWLGVHAMLMNGLRNRVDLFVSWGWDYFTKNRDPSIIDDEDASTVAWDEHD